MRQKRSTQFYVKPQDIDVASIEPIQSFLKFYIDYYIIVIYIKFQEALY